MFLKKNTEKTIIPPKWLFWLLGKKISIINLVLFGLTSLLVTTLLILNSTNVFFALPLLEQIGYVILALFNFFTVGLNLTLELSKIYETSRKNKLIYILANITPLLLFIIVKQDFWCYFGVWAYTVVASLFVLLFKGRPTQKAVGFGALILAMFLFATYFQNLSGLYSLLLMAHIANVLFAVAVSQYLEYKY